MKFLEANCLKALIFSFLLTLTACGESQNPPISSALKNSPPARVNAASAYDPNNHITLLFGGQTEVDYHKATLLNDTWILNSTWGLIDDSHPKPLLYNPKMVYNPDLKALVLLGQDVDSSSKIIAKSTSTWVWHTTYWQKLLVSQSFPLNLINTSVAYSGSVRGLLLLGRVDGASVPASSLSADNSRLEMWSLTGNNWSLVWKMAVDKTALGSISTIFEGSKDTVFALSTALTDKPVTSVFSWGTNNWHLQDAANAPQDILNTAFDWQNNHEIIYGLSSSYDSKTLQSVSQQHTFIFDGSTWVKSKAVIEDGTFSGMTFFYAASTSHVMSFGGVSSKDPALQPVPAIYAFNGNKWTLQ